MELEKTREPASAAFKMRINLLIVRVPKEKALVQRQALVFIAVLAATFVALGYWTNAVYAAKSGAEEELSADKARLTKLESVQKKIDEFDQKKKRREQILQAIKKLEERKQGPRPYLDELNVLLPPDIWITEVNATNTSFSITGNSFSNAAIADLMRAMEASAQFQDVELSIIQNEVVQKENIKKFTLNCTLEALAKLEEAKKEPDKGKPAGGK